MEVEMTTYKIEVLLEEGNTVANFSYSIVGE